MFNLGTSFYTLEWNGRGGEVYIFYDQVISKYKNSVRSSFSTLKLLKIDKYDDNAANFQMTPPPRPAHSHPHFRITGKPFEKVIQCAPE